MAYEFAMGEYLLTIAKRKSGVMLHVCRDKYVGQDIIFVKYDGTIHNMEGKEYKVYKKLEDFKAAYSVALREMLEKYDKNLYKLLFIMGLDFWKRKKIDYLHGRVFSFESNMLSFNFKDKNVSINLKDVNLKKYLRKQLEKSEQIFSPNVKIQIKSKKPILNIVLEKAPTKFKTLASDDICIQN